MALPSARAFPLLLPLPVVLGLSVCACDALPWGPTQSDPTRRAAERAVDQDITRQLAETEAKKERARVEAEELERKKVAEQTAAQKAERALSLCCEALAKAGFEQRSMELMAATKSCEAALAEKKELTNLQAELREKLGGAPLPASCTP